MHARPVGRRRAVAFAAATSLLLGAWNDVVVIRLPGYPASYVPGNLAATALLLTAARAEGMTWQQLGFDPDRLRHGARWGGLGSAVVAAGYTLGLTVPAARPLLADARVAGAGGAEIASQVLIRIPLGTVLWEETAFRGVLLAALLRVLPPRTAIGASAAVFGLWHIRPTLSAVVANDLADGLPGRTAAVLSGCVGTAAAGVLFTGLRMGSGSLLAPLLVHAATNCLGMLAAAAAHRLDPRQPGSARSNATRIDGGRRSHHAAREPGTGARGVAAIWRLRLSGPTVRRAAPRRGRHDGHAGTHDQGWREAGRQGGLRDGRHAWDRLGDLPKFCAAGR